MHKTRIAIMTIVGISLLAGGAAAADVAVNGTIPITSGDTTVIAQTDSAAGDQLAFTTTSELDYITLNTSEGDIAFNGSNATSATVTTGSTSGLDDVDSGLVNLADIQTTGGYLKTIPVHKQPYRINASGAGVAYYGVSVGDGSQEFTVTSDNKVDILADAGISNSKLLVVDNFASPKEYLTSDTTQSDGTVRITYQQSGTEQVYLKQPAPISFSDIQPPDGGQTNETDATLQVRVESADFDYDGFSYDVKFRNEDTDEVTKNEPRYSNETAIEQREKTVNGVNTWSFSIETIDGRTKTTGNLTFITPDFLTIRNESRPTQVLSDNVSFTVRFIGDDDTIIERTTSNGKISLSGLDRDVRYIVTIRPTSGSEFVYRRIIVDKLGEEASAYLLKKQESTSEVKFELDDPTGQFPPTQTRLYVEKPLTRDYDGDQTNETRYAIVAGDVFGASGSFPMIVENGQRYRLRVESENSQQSRVLGAYSTQSPERVPIQIEDISPSGDVDGGRVVYGGVEGEQVVVRYLDPTQSTQSVEYRVIDDASSVVVPNTTRNSQQFADFYDLPAGENASYTVEYTITRENGNTTAGSFDAGRIVGGVSERLDTNPDILELTSYVFIIASMGRVVLVNASLAPLTGTGVATLLTVFGLVAIPAPILGIAGAISVLLPIGRR